MRSLKLALLSVFVVWPHFVSAEQIYGAWLVNTTNDGAIFAATVDDSENILGQYCFIEEETCIWILGMSTACNEGEKYPVLINADTGAYQMSAYCSAQPKRNRYWYIFSEFGQIDTIVKKAMQINFAIPFQGDQFKGMKFDLNGSNDAINFLKATTAKARENKSTDYKSSKNSLVISEDNRIPQFRDYPASNTYVGKHAEVVLSTADEKAYRTRLREATKQPANFAGEYVLTAWGCGTSCIYGAVVSLKTGRVVFLPGSICCWNGEGENLEFRINSRLLVAAGVINEESEHGAHFYEFTGREFRHLKTIPVAKSRP